MNTQEAAKILLRINTNYHRKLTEAETKNEILFFAAEFKDENAERVNNAVSYILKTSKYIPNVADIRAAMRRATLTALPAESIRIGTGAEGISDERLEEICKWLGFGYPEHTPNYYDETGENSGDPSQRAALDYFSKWKL